MSARRPSVSEYASLANAVYEPGMCPKDWCIFDEARSCNAVTYQSREDKRQIVVAFRGTADLADLITDVSILFNRESAAFFLAFAYYAQIKEKCLPDPAGSLRGYCLGLTGHSLGGALAAFCAFYARYTHIYPSAQACVFNAVPIHNLVRRYFSDARLGSVSFIKNYDDRYDVVSRIFGKRQLGESYVLMDAESRKGTCIGFLSWLLDRSRILTRHSMTHMKNKVEKLFSKKGKK